MTNTLAYFSGRGREVVQHRCVISNAAFYTFVVKIKIVLARYNFKKLLFGSNEKIPFLANASN